MSNKKTLKPLFPVSGGLAAVGGSPVQHCNNPRRYPSYYHQSFFVMGAGLKGLIRSQPKKCRSPISETACRVVKLPAQGSSIMSPGCDAAKMSFVMSPRGFVWGWWCFALSDQTSGMEWFCHVFFAITGGFWSTSRNSDLFRRRDPMPNLFLSQTRRSTDLRLVLLW